MIIPKLLLLVPVLLLVEAQNDPQREFNLAERLPLRRPVITPGFRSESPVPPVPNTPMTIKQIPEVVTQQYIPAVKEEVKNKSPEFSPSVSRQPIQRPSRPTNEPIDTSSSSIAPPSTVNENILISRFPPSATEVEVTPKNPEVSESNAQEPEAKKPGFTIISGDASNPPIFSGNARQTRVIPRLELDESIKLTISQPGKPSYTIIIFKNDTEKSVDPTKAPPTTSTSTSTSTTTARSTTVIQTTPTQPQTPTTTSTTTMRPSTVFRTTPTPPVTPVSTSTTTRRSTTVVQTRPTPPTTVDQINPSTLPTNAINQLYDYNCRNVNGYYSVANKCDEYILCQSNNAYQIVCPDGLHFDPAVKWPAYPCAYPSEVKCQDQSITQRPQPTNECPRRHGYFPVPGGDCGQYIVCQEGIATVMPCPPGLVFNELISTCDWPVNVPGCNPSVFEGFTCPAPKVDNFGHSEIINFRYKNSCKNYIACQEGRPRLLSCDYGLSFDEQARRCVDSSLTRNCEY